MSHYHVRQGPGPSNCCKVAGTADTTAETMEQAFTLGEKVLADLKSGGFRMTDTWDVYSFKIGLKPSARWYFSIPHQYGSEQMLEIAQCDQSCFSETKGG